MLAASMALGLLSTVALAADLPTTKGPPVFEQAPPPVFSWTGFYIGANAGGSLGNFTTTDAVGLFGTGDENYASSRGFSGGGQLGFNYQFAGSNFVVGVEADFQGSTLQGTYDSENINGQAGWRDASK
ncbi:MAG TPA: porin family protein, partial [Methylovirgula sp.]